MAAEQRRELRPNNDGSVCCTAEPLIRVLHAALMTDRGESLPAPPTSLHAARIAGVAGSSPELEESVGRSSGAAGLQTPVSLLVPVWSSFTPGTGLVQSLLKARADVEVAENPAEGSLVMFRSIRCRCANNERTTAGGRPAHRQNLRSTSAVNTDKITPPARFLSFISVECYSCEVRACTHALTHACMHAHTDAPQLQHSGVE